MESISKALAVIGTIGVACGIMGCIGLFSGGPFGDFMQGATPGIVIGLSALLLIIRPKADQASQNEASDLASKIEASPMNEAPPRQ